MLDFSSLLIEQKPFLLLTWKLQSSYKIKIGATGLKFYGKDGNAVVLLKSDADRSSIMISNSWFTHKHTLVLKHLSLDAQTATFLLKNIREIKSNGEVTWNLPAHQTPLSVRSINVVNPALAVRNIPTNLKIAKPHFYKKISIHSPQFNQQQ